MREPLVSIGLPTYNGGRTLARAIESVLKQSYQNLELIISDNASSDDTPSICKQAFARDPRIRYLQQQKNRGPIQNFLEVLRQSSGEFFMWLSDDDWLDQSYVNDCLQILLERPDYIAVCGWAEYFRNGEFAFDGTIQKLHQENGSERVLEYLEKVTDNGILYSVMRRNEILEIPLRNVMGGDWLFMAEVAFRGKIETLENVRVYRERGGTSDSYVKIAETLGLRKFSGSYPHLTIGGSVLADIVWRSSSYSRIGIFKRIALGIKAFELTANRDGFYFRPRQLASLTLAKVLPESALGRYRNWRSQRRGEIGR